MSKSVANPTIGVGLDLAALDSGLAKIRETANRALAAVEKRIGPNWMDQLAASGEHVNKILADTRGYMARALDQLGKPGPDPFAAMRSSGSGAGARMDPITARLNFGSLGAMAGSTAPAVRSGPDPFAAMMAADKARIEQRNAEIVSASAAARAYADVSNGAFDTMADFWADVRQGVGRGMVAAKRAGDALIDRGRAWGGWAMGGLFGRGDETGAGRGIVPRAYDAAKSVSLDPFGNALQLNATLDLLGKLRSGLGSLLGSATPKSDQLDDGVRAGGQSLMNSNTMTGTLARLSADWEKWVDDSWQRLSSVFDFQGWAESGRGAMAAFTAIWDTIFGPAEENAKSAEQLLEAYKSGASTALDVFGGIVEISIRTREIFWGIVDSVYQLLKYLPGASWAMGDAPGDFKFDGNADREALNQVLQPIRDRFAEMTVADFAAGSVVDPVESANAVDGFKGWISGLAGAKDGLAAITAEYEKNQDQLAAWANRVGDAFLATAEGVDLYNEAAAAVEQKKLDQLGQFANQLAASVPDFGSFNAAGNELGSANLAASIAAAMSYGMTGRQTAESQMIAALEMQNRHQSETAENTAILVQVLSRIQPGQTLQFGGAF